MRSKGPSAVLLSLLVPLAGVLPVVSLPQADPRPVTPQVRSVPLEGVDRAAVGGSELVRSGRVSTKAWSAPGRGTARGTGRPEVLVSRRGVASFDLLGVTWARHAGARPAPQLTVLVRTHDEGGWARWTALDPAPTPGRAEARTARPGTEPLWVDGADGYQVRVDVRRGSVPRGLRVDLIDPGSSPADSSVGSARTLQDAQAAAGQPQILSRTQWGADERLRRTAPRYNATVKAGFVHHTAGSNSYSEADVPKILRAVYAYHVKGNGWSDIGYNYLVDRFGRLWEGRYGGLDSNVLGAHTGGFNVDTFAVSAIGNFDKTAAPPVMVDAIARAMAWKLARSFRDPSSTTSLVSEGGGTSRFSAGTRVTMNVVSGHRDAGRTSCPGSNLYAQLPTIRALTTSYLGTTLYDPAPSATTVVHGSGASIVTTARVNSAQQWTLEVRDACRGILVRTLTGVASPVSPVSASWDLRDQAGVPVRPGGYTMRLVGADATASTHPWTTTVTVNAARTPAVASPPVPLPGPAGFVPLDPVRLYDTRPDGRLPVGPAQQLTLKVAGVGKVPETGVAAVALNMATSCSTRSTAVTAWPAGATKPVSAALTARAGIGSSALAVTALGGNGSVSIANRSGTSELSVDVVGYYPVAGGQVFRPTAALRLYDSRQDPAGPLVPGVGRTVTMPTLSGISATAMTGALLTVTARNARGFGSLTVQSPESDKQSETVRYARGRPVKNRAVAQLSNGSFTVTARDNATHVVVDVHGWWAPPEVTGGGLFQARPVTKVLDTRSGVGVRRGRVGAGADVTLRVAGKGRPVPGSARAVVLTVGAVDATRGTYVTTWPRGAKRPEYPDLSVPAWTTTSNLVVVRIGAKNRVRLGNQLGSTHLVADVVGYYR